MVVKSGPGLTRGGAPPSYAPGPGHGRSREEPLRVTVHYRNAGATRLSRDQSILASSTSSGRWGSGHQVGSLGPLVSRQQGGVRRVRFDLPPQSPQSDDNDMTNDATSVVTLPGGVGLAGIRGGASGTGVGASAGSGAPAGSAQWTTGRHSHAHRQSPSPGSAHDTAPSRYRAGTLAGTLAGSAALLNAARDGDHHTFLEIMRRNPPASTLNQRDAQGRTAASHLASDGPLPLMELLLQTPGLDANLPDNEGNTPLHFAAQAGQLEAVNALLRLRQSDIQVDARNNQGFTPLMKAALQGRTKCARALLLAGASPTLRDSGRGLRAEQWARFCGRHVCAELIERLARQRLLDRATAYGRWGSEPELQAALSRVQQARLPPPQHNGIKSRMRRAFRTNTGSGMGPPDTPGLCTGSRTPAFSLVTQLTGAGLCASTPALPVPSMPPVVKSLLRPLSVPRLQVTLAGEPPPPPLPPRDARPPHGPPPPPPPSIQVTRSVVRAK